MIKTQGDIRYDVTWKTLGEYLDFLVKKGVSPNVASFVGATSVREYVVGYDDVTPTANNSSRCRTWCARPCARARSASAAR